MGVALAPPTGVLVGMNVPGVPVNGVPVPKVAVKVSRTGFWVSVAVTCVAGEGVTVIVDVSIATTGVLLGGTVAVGAACSVCCEKTAEVARKSSSEIGDGLAAAPGTDGLFEVPHALIARLSAIIRKNIFFISISFVNFSCG